MTKLKGVAIGAGYFSKFHFEAWRRLADVELAAICDLNPEAAKAAAGEFGVSRVYSDVEEMFEQEQPDFVDIITRPESHLKLVEAAAARGIDVICQKPLTPTFAESKQLVATATASGIRLMIHENFRFQPWYRQIKRLLETRAAGDRLHSISIRTRTGDGWQTDAYLDRQPYFRTMPQFLVHETGVHFIDTLRFLGGEITGVYASLRTLNSNIRGEDAGLILFEFSDGARGMWDANRFNESTCVNPRYTFGEALIEGNGGSIRLYEDGKLTIQRLGETEKEHAYDCPTKNFAGDCVHATQKHFVACLRSGAEFETSGQSYLHTLAVQEAVYQSAQSGNPVRGLTEQLV